jgi:hypothetical protein
MVDSTDETISDSSADKPWRIVTEVKNPYAAVEYDDAVRIAEAVEFVEGVVEKALSLLQQGKTPKAVEGLHQVQLVLGHWSSEAVILAERLKVRNVPA